ncbi:MAG: porphobilinogen synthase [Nitriliruptoraceae bacterium]
MSPPAPPAAGAHRPRRLRASAARRRLVRETHLRPDQLVLPLFLREGLDAPRPIEGLPGVLQHSEGSLVDAAREAVTRGVGGLMLFGVPAHRDATGTCATDPGGVLTRGVRALKEAVGDDAVLLPDLCLDEFTDHGHCGVLDERGQVDNDATLVRYQEMAAVLAEAGADLLGTSGMMDGQVGAVRSALDAAGHLDVGVLAYAAKYASVLYGPFRNAVESTLEGDRRTYQQDPANRREARREVALDLAEGADIVMVKPALTYLDVVADTAASIDVPVAAYVVSGEHTMLELAAAAGAFDRRAAVLEALTGVHRAGADVLCTYWATEVAGWLQEA